MSSRKSGFILIDALICCLIMAVCSSLTLASLRSHENIHEEIKKTKEEMEEEWERFYPSVPGCVLCEEEKDSS